MMTFKLKLMQVALSAKCLLLLILMVGLGYADPAATAQRITQVAGARVRAEASAQGALVTVLPFGTVLEELARTETPQRIGDSEDYWYQLALPDGAEGWIFGSLTLPFEPERAADLYQQLADTRLAQESSFAEFVELANFLAQVKDQVAEPTAAGRLSLAHLQAVRRSLELINLAPEEPTYQQWLAELQTQGLLAYNESADQYLLPLAQIWAVHDHFYPLPIADEIAWLAVTNPWGGECEGFLSCVLEVVQNTSGRYLKWHPEGNYAPSALDNIASLLEYGEAFPEEYPLISRHLGVLQATVARSDAGELPGQLEALRQRYQRP